MTEINNIRLWQSLAECAIAHNAETRVFGYRRVFSRVRETAHFSRNARINWSCSGFIR